MSRLRKPASIALLVTFAFFLLALEPVAAQEPTGLAATLEVLEAGVEVLRADTSNWILVNRESIVGTGDTIRTDDTGRARITFFADGTASEILPNSEYRIDQFRGNDTSFTLILELVIGQSLQTLGRVLDTSTEYQMITPAMSLSARGTAFVMRVEPTGRAAMFVSDGLVDASDEEATSQVPPAFGIRADTEGELSDVVRASTFDELDAALDGCTAVVTMLDDVSYNVRAVPSTDAAIVAMLPAQEIDRFFGVTQTNAGVAHFAHLGGMLGGLRNGGLGREVDSWVSTGPNQPVSPQQLEMAIRATPSRITDPEPVNGEGRVGYLRPSTAKVSSR